MKKRLLDALGLLLVGDGILSLVDPKRHCLLWEIGPKPCRALIDEFVQHPRVTRIAGVAEAALGILLAEMQTPK
jgi:hypothetical protein